MSATTDVAYLFLLVVAVIWTVLSGLMMLVSVYAGDEVPAWGWAASFVVSSLAVAYCFWRLW